MSRILHISNSRYESIEAAGHTLRIWRELAVGTEAYHVLARRSASLRPATHREGAITLHLLPGTSTKLFPLLAYHGAVIAVRHRPDVIVCQDPVLGGLAGVQIGRILGVPTLIEVHTDRHFANMTSQHPPSAMLGRIAVHTLTRATRVRVISPNMQGPLIEAGVSPEALVHVPNRVDHRLFGPDPERRRRGQQRIGAADDDEVVLSIGRFVVEKGYVHLIAAFARVVRERPRARLVLVGGGHLEPEYLRAAHAAGVASALTLLPWLDQHSLADLLAAADVYAQPSVSEAMPRSVLEAMASGLAVVASRVGGIPDVLDDGTGVTVEPGDRDALATAMLRLLGDPLLRAQMGEAARRTTVARHSWDATFDQYRACLAALAAGVG